MSLCPETGNETALIVVLAHTLFSALVKERGFISLSRSVINGIVNVLWKYCWGVAARVFARYSCRHSRNLRLRLTECDSIVGPVITCML